MVSNVNIRSISRVDPYLCFCSRLSYIEKQKIYSPNSLICYKIMLIILSEEYNEPKHRAHYNRTN
jgi:hypothetical protein